MVSVLLELLFFDFGFLCLFVFFVRGEVGGFGGRVENRLRVEEVFLGVAFLG